MLEARGCVINRNKVELLKNIKLVATDCDGVLTDGGLYYSATGEEYKRFQVLDGVGFIRLRENGIKTAIISGENTEILDHRARRLKADYLYKGTLDKLTALRDICDKEAISIEETVYIGDDWFDVDAIEAAGFGCAPKSAMKQVRVHADYVTKAGGGHGCFREVAELILKMKGMK